MIDRAVFAAPRPSRTALLVAAGLAATCLIAPYPAHALVSTAYVSNCGDTGAGSLRQALLDVADGGTIDAHTQLAGVCGSISIISEQLSFAGDSLTIVGPGPDQLKITAFKQTGSILHHYQNRIFSHTGRGTLTFENISVFGGFVTTTSNITMSGGCIQSTGSVKLINSNVSGCTVNTPAQANGGAIQAQGNVYLSSSQVTVNTAIGTTYGARGGGISAGSITLRQSTVAGNTASGSTDMESVVDGGGAWTAGGMDIAASTISGNVATGGKLTHYGTQTSEGGGIYSRGTVSISNSTVSGNSAGYYGGAKLNATSATITNSTFAFNTSDSAAGVSLSATVALTIDSDLFSNNLSGSTPNDLAIIGSVAPSGTHNLVYATSSPVPGGTLRSECPLLAPLADNGGPTQTHALYSHSPAINAGDNTQSLSTDQRGSGYPRVIGTAADIGSYEVKTTDELFGSGFDGC